MKRRRTFTLCVALLCGLLVAGGVSATSTADYDLSWWTVDGGGGTLVIEGGYSLSGTAGQPDAGLLASNSYTLSGSFWVGGIYRVYLPLILSQSP